MRTTGPCATALLAVVLGACAGGGDDGQGQRNPNAIVEKQLASGERRATWRDTVVLQLEPAEDLLGAALGDTGPGGVDHVPFDSDGGRHVFCLQDPDGVPHRFRILDDQGVALLSLDVGGCGEVDLPVGPYRFELEHGRRGDADAGTAAFFLQPADLDVAGRARSALGDRGLGRVSSALVESCTPACIPQPATYRDVKNALGPGQALLFTGACPPADGDTVYKYATSCGDTGHDGVVGAQAGQFTSVAAFGGPGLNGPVWAVANSRVQCWSDAAADPRAGWLGKAHFALRVAAHSDCGLKRAELHCWNCPLPSRNTPAPVLAAGEVLVLGTVPAPDTNGEPCCHAGLVFDGDCSDLGLVGFDDAIERVVVGSGTAVMLYGDTGMQGLSQSYRLPGAYDLPADGQGVVVGAKTASSLLVGTQEQVNRGILIAGRSCGGCDLRGVDLTNAMLSGAYLQKADLTDAILTGAQLDGADLTSAKLYGTRLRLANLKGAKIRSAQLSRGAQKTDLTQAWLAGAALDGADLSDANCRGAHFSGPGGGCTMTKAILKATDFTGAVMREVSLKEAAMPGAIFQSAWLVNADLTSLGLTADPSVSGLLSFEDAWLPGADFTGTVLDKATLEGARFAMTPGGADVPEYTSVTMTSAGPVYATETLNYRYAAQYPDRMPHQTTANTTCPDGSRGPCQAVGGESVHSCRDECASECETRVNCRMLPWPAGKAGGHWECVSGTCAAVPDASLTTGSRCGDGTCDRATAETASSCPGDCGQQCVPGDPRGCLALPWPAGVGGGSWKCDANGLCQARASRFVCGDGACSPDLGESAASCPADCGTTFRCSQAEDCLAAAWPDGAAGGRWACTGGQCAAVPGSGACGSPCSYAAGLPVGCPCCGDGRCDLAQGEGPGSCPADCQGGGCASAAECAALPWSDAREGHWACASDRTCVAVFDTALDASKRECGGTDGACHFHGQWERRPDVP